MKYDKKHLFINSFINSRKYYV